MKIFASLLGVLTLIALAIACGSSSSSSSTGATTGSSSLSGSMNEGILNKTQYSGNELSYSVTATNASSSTNTSGSLGLSTNTVIYEIGTLLANTEYDITVWKGAGGSNTVVAQVTATTEASGSSKPRSAAGDTSYELNTFSTFYSEKVKSLRTSGNSNPSFYAKFEVFPFSTATNISNFGDVKMSNGIATMTVSGNKQALTPNAKANASIKFITQVAKSVVYMSDNTLIKQSGNLSNMLTRASTTSSMNEITDLYTDDTLGFSELMKDVSEDLPPGQSFGNIISEIDPVLANMDFIEAIDNTDFSGGAGALDTFFDTTFASAENLTKTMLSYELALETFSRDIVEFTYDVDTELFFEDFGDEFADEFSADNVNIGDWSKEAMGDLKDIFDADFDDGSDDFAFEFDESDLTYLYTDLSNEILDVLSQDDNFDVQGWDDSFETIDFGDEFGDLDFDLGVINEDLLAGALGSSNNIRIVDVRLAHPTYGSVKRTGGNNEMVLSSLAPVFRVQLLPSEALTANVALQGFSYGDLFHIQITQNGNVISVGNSVLTSSFEDDSFYIAFHKGASTDLASNELMPGQEYGYELVPSQNVELFDFAASDIMGTFTTRDITFTLPFDGVTSTASQVNLPMFVPEFFEIDIEAPDKTEYLEDISSSVFDAAEINNSTQITGIRMTFTSNVLSEDGTYEIRVKNGDQLTWDEDGQTTTVGANSYQARHFYDVVLDQSFLLDEDLLAIEGSSSTTVSPLNTATPSLYVHSVHGIVVNSGMIDYGLFDAGKISLQALNHSEPIIFEEDDFSGVDGLSFETLIGVWIDEKDSTHVLTFDDDGTYSETSDSGTTKTGTWDVVLGNFQIDGDPVLVELDSTFTELSVLNADGTVDTVWEFDPTGGANLPDTTDPTTGGSNIVSSFIVADNIIGDWTEIGGGNMLSIGNDFTWSESNAAGVVTESGNWEIISGNVYVDGDLEVITFSSDYSSFTSYDDDGSIGVVYIMSGNSGTVTSMIGSYVSSENIIGDWVDSQSGNLLTISDNNSWSESDPSGNLIEEGQWEIISGNWVVDSEDLIVELTDDNSSFTVLFADGTVDQVWTASNSTTGTNSSKTAYELQMVDLPGGLFTMGESENDYQGAPGTYAANLHEVTITSFAMSETEVTNQQYVDFLNAAEVDGWLEIQADTTGGDAGDNIVYGSSTTDANLQGNGWLNLDGTRVMKDHDDDDGDGESFSGNIDPENPLNISFIGYDIALPSGNRFYVKDPESDFDWQTLTNYYNYTANSSSTSIEYDTSVMLNDYADWPELASGSLPTLEDVQNWPANFVRWQGAKAFALYYGYDLPTEAEWEYAAQGGSSYVYATSNGNVNGDGTSAIWNDTGANPSLEHVQDVKSNDANPYGLYNLAGNVWEWVEDDYDTDFYVSSADSTDPVNSTGSGVRVRRGGSWNYHEATLKSASRFSDEEFKGNDHFGFRVVWRASLP